MLTESDIAELTRRADAAVERMMGAAEAMRSMHDGGVLLPARAAALLQAVADNAAVALEATAELRRNVDRIQAERN